MKNPLTIVLSLLLVITTTLLVVYKFESLGITVLIVAFITALVFTNLDKIETVRVKDLFEATMRKVEASIQKEITRSIPSPELLYEHGKNGEMLKGSIEKLIQAVEDGYPIKIKIYHPTYTQIIDAQLLTIENNTVYASNTYQISQDRDKLGNIVYREVEELYHYYVIAGSNGHLHQTRVRLDGKRRDDKEKENSIRRHMVWLGVMPAILDK